MNSRQQEDAVNASVALRTQFFVFPSSGQVTRQPKRESEKGQWWVSCQANHCRFACGSSDRSVRSRPGSSKVTTRQASWRTAPSEVGYRRVGDPSLTVTSLMLASFAMAVVTGLTCFHLDGTPHPQHGLAKASPRFCCCRSPVALLRTSLRTEFNSQRPRSRRHPGPRSPWKAGAAGGQRSRLALCGPAPYKMVVLRKYSKCKIIVKKMHNQM